MKHQPRKRFGQNFLSDQKIIQDLINFLNLISTDVVIEIGPGIGALTEPLLGQVDKLVAIEIDRDLVAKLFKVFKSQKNLTLITADALQIAYSQWGENIRVVGNLPYNIATPLLIKLLDYKQFIKDLHLMLQKEVALRLAAQPGNKNYGRLSIITQYHCAVELLALVPAAAFDPRPKVSSAILRLTPYKSSPYAPVNICAFKYLITKAFSMRRKTLANNLMGLISAEQIVDLGMDPKLRPEQIKIEQYIILANSPYIKRLVGSNATNQ